MPDEVPWEIRLTLRAGTVYYFADHALTTAEPHYFVVINPRPIEDQVLVLTVITSQVEKVRAFRSTLPGTTLELGPGDYAELSKPSIIDCNCVFRRSIREMLTRIGTREVTYKADVSDPLVAQIRAAVLASPLVDRAIKELLR